MKKLVSLFKNLYGITAGIGAIIPGFTYFIKETPPLFPGIGLIVSALCVGLLFYMVIGKEEKKHKPGSGWFLLVTAIAFLIGYLLLFDFTTINYPDSGNPKAQIGFGLSDWSITNDAKELINSKMCRGNSKEDILMCVGFTRENIFIIWPRWAVYSAGIALMFAFTVSALTWVLGWGKLGLAYLSNKINENE